MRFFVSAILSLYALHAVFQFGSARAQNQNDTVWPTKGWLTSAPEDQGMDSSETASLVAFGANHSFDSLLVVRHGRIVAEAYYAPYRADIPHEIHSCTKAVISTLVHFCLGAPLARAEAEIAIRLLFERFRSLRLDPQHPIEHKQVPVFNGLKALWVRAT